MNIVIACILGMVIPTLILIGTLCYQPKKNTSNTEKIIEQEKERLPNPNKLPKGTNVANPPCCKHCQYR